LSVATALPANSVLSDKARIFNENIRELYPEFGSSDELDRFEGTSKLDTLYLVTAKELDLAKHYGIKPSEKALYHASMKLRHHSKISKSEYGELKVKVWDTDPGTAALICNTLLQKLQDIHSKLQNQRNLIIVKKLKEIFQGQTGGFTSDSIILNGNSQIKGIQKNIDPQQLLQYQKLINEYEIAIATNPPALLVVEYGHPAVRHDKPDTTQTVLLAFLASFAFTFLLALFIESRKS
jgi:hypothetical protein